MHDEVVEFHRWARLDVSTWAVTDIERAGSHENLWLAEPETGALWLHKDTATPSNGVEQGEDWSEVVSTQVAALLGVPCATTRLCLRHGRRGSLSRSVRPIDADLWEGKVVLEDLGATDYFPHVERSPGVDPARPGVKRPGHSLRNIKLALESVAAPPGFDGPASLDAFDVFVGYLLLDALIANRDRHEQNWAVLRPQLLGPSVRLCPSYDHASSLGYNLADLDRERRLASDDAMVRWAKRGTAWRFEHIGKPTTLVAHAMKAVQLASPEGANWWRSQIEAMDLDPLMASLRDQQIWGMSHLAVTFAHRLLDVNLRRLRDEFHDRP